MVTDYEAAWSELAAVVARKTQHGREGLLAEMATIAERNRVPAGELSRLLRLYGVEVERARSIVTETQPAGSSASAGDSIPGGTGGPRRIIDHGGHDGGVRDGVAVG